jgi:hypothetical protein
VFQNPTANPITVPVRIVGNLGSDEATSVFATSDGDAELEVTDQWIGADDVDGNGTPAIVHYIHGPAGIVPTGIALTGDNIEWTYSLTVPAGETVRLAHFTILATDRSDAVAAAESLVRATEFGGYAAVFLTADELNTLANFRFQDATVAGRHVFYNQSSFDGNDAGLGAIDDAAIASDKTALLPGQTAGFANYTSFSRGINGLMVDVRDLPPGNSLSAADFRFKIGNSNAPDGWSTAPPPSSVYIRRGAGSDGSDRITLVWPEGAIKRTWLEVTILPTLNTGLADADVFYFGNAVGETGNSTTNAIVSSFDEGLIRLNGRKQSSPAPIDFRYDMNRDGLVNSADQVIARLNATNALTALRLIAPLATAESNGAVTTLTEGSLASTRRANLRHGVQDLPIDSPPYVLGLNRRRR